MKLTKTAPLVRRCGIVFHRYMPKSPTRSVGVLRKTKLLVLYQNSQQNQKFGQGSSTSSDAPRFIEQQEYQPQLTQFGLGYEEDAGWNESKEHELSKLEAEYEESRFANYSLYDDGYCSDNYQTWDHLDY